MENDTENDFSRFINEVENGRMNNELSPFCVSMALDIIIDQQNDISFLKNEIVILYDLFKVYDKQARDLLNDLLIIKQSLIQIKNILESGSGGHFIKFPEDDPINKLTK